MRTFVIVVQINDIVMQIPAPLTLISTHFLDRTLLTISVTAIDIVTVIDTINLRYTEHWTIAWDEPIAFLSQDVQPYV